MKNGTKLMAGVLTAGLLAGGGTTAAVLAGGATAAATAATTATSATSAPSFVPFPLQQLVDNGTITQAQATAIHNALYQYVEQHGPASGWTGTTPPVLEPGPLATVLGQLVKNGTITQAQANAITSAISAQVKAHFGSRPWGPGYGPMMGTTGFTPPWAGSSS